MGKVLTEPRVFIGRPGKYQIPNGARVVLVRCYARRKCVIEYAGTQYISSVALLRRLRGGNNSGVKNEGG